MKKKISKRNKIVAMKMLKLAKRLISAPQAEIDPEDMKISQIKKEIFQLIKTVPISKSDKLRRLLPDVGTINMKNMKVVDFMEMFLKMLRAKSSK